MNAPFANCSRCGGSSFHVHSRDLSSHMAECARCGLLFPGTPAAARPPVTVPPAGWHVLEPAAPPARGPRWIDLSAPVVTHWQSSRHTALVALRNGYVLTAGGGRLVVSLPGGLAPVSLPFSTALPPEGARLLESLRELESPDLARFALLTFAGGWALDVDDRSLSLTGPGLSRGITYTFPAAAAADDRETAEVPNSDSFAQPLALA
jgi:hypothetical protein